MPLTQRGGNPNRGGKKGTQAYSLRGIFCKDSDFTGLYPASSRPFDSLGTTHMECFCSNAAQGNALTRMNLLAAPTMGWTVMSSFTPSSGGGSFSINDTNCATIIDNLANHARNSHIYYIADEPNIQQFTTPQQDANLATIRARRNLIKAHDPSAIVCLADYRQNQIQPAASGRTYGMWGGTDLVGATTYTDRVVDMIITSGYASPSIDVETTRLTDQAAWCDAAGVPYIIGISVHRNPVGGSSPSYPTTTQVATQISHVKQTNSRGIWIYIWDQDGVDPRLSTDASMQSFLAAQLATVTP